MSGVSPTLEGFRAAFRRPALTFAEITWRWVIGATATALFFFGFFEYLNSLPVSRGEMLFLRTRHPYLVAQAIAHIFRGSFTRAALSLLVAALLMLILWVVAGALGRVVTVRAMLDDFRQRFAANTSETTATDLSPEPRQISANATSSFQSLVCLNCLRAALAIAAIFGLIGAGILASFASPDTNPRPGLAFLLFVPLAGVVTLFWWVLNWLLSLAAVFAVRDQGEAMAAVSAAVALFRQRTGAVMAVSSWTGLAHLVLFVAASTVVSVPLAFVPLVPWRLAVLAMILITLVYFAIADWLYMARLAGYVCIAEMPEAMFAPLPRPVAPFFPTPLQTTMDRDELILSDIPNLATES
jgi:hypothetical protein